MQRGSSQPNYQYSPHVLIWTHKKYVTDAGYVSATITITISVVVVVVVSVVVVVAAAAVLAIVIIIIIIIAIIIFRQFFVCPDSRYFQWKASDFPSSK